MPDIRSFYYQKIVFRVSHKYFFLFDFDVFYPWPRWLKNIKLMIVALDSMWK